jgi:hypothetical protein
MKNIIRISPRKQLQKHRRVTVSIGTAADGLPLLLLVDRGESPEELLAPIASRLGYNSPYEYSETPFSDIVRQLENMFNQRDIKSIDTEKGTLECYVCNQPIDNIVGSTLLNHLLDFRTPLSSFISSMVVTDTRATADTEKKSSLAEGEAQQPRVRAEVGNLKLALPLDDSPAITIRCIEKPKREFSFRYSHVFEPESLSRLKTARFHAFVPGKYYEESFEGSMDDKLAYVNARQRCLESSYRYVFNCRIAKSELCSLLIETAIELGKLHENGEIHGDVKPSNILTTANGVSIIDSLVLKPGDRSPAMTQGWAAPEQILGKDVDFTTDQYPLGLMLCRFLGGVLYGEELTFLVPTGGSNLERFTLLRNPGVYLDPDTVPIDNEGIFPWRNLIERCLQFVPQDRFPSTSDLVSEFKEVNSNHPVQGESEIGLNFGELVMAQFEGTEASPMWRATEIRFPTRRKR